MKPISNVFLLPVMLTCRYDNNLQGQVFSLNFSLLPFFSLVFYPRTQYLLPQSQVLHLYASVHLDECWGPCWFHCHPPGTCHRLLQLLTQGLQPLSTTPTLLPLPQGQGLKLCTGTESKAGRQHILLHQSQRVQHAAELPQPGDRFRMLTGGRGNGSGSTEAGGT